MECREALGAIVLDADTVGLFELIRVLLVTAHSYGLSAS